MSDTGTFKDPLPGPPASGSAAKPHKSSVPLFIGLVVVAAIAVATLDKVFLDSALSRLADSDDPKSPVGMLVDHLKTENQKLTTKNDELQGEIKKDLRDSLSEARADHVTRDEARAIAREESREEIRVSVTPGIIELGEHVLALSERQDASDTLAIKSAETATAVADGQARLASLTEEAVLAQVDKRIDEKLSPIEAKLDELTSRKGPSREDKKAFLDALSEPVPGGATEKPSKGKPYQTVSELDASGKPQKIRDYAYTWGHDPTIPEVIKSRKKGGEPLVSFYYFALDPATNGHQRFDIPAKIAVSLGCYGEDGAGLRSYMVKTEDGVKTFPGHRVLRHGETIFVFSDDANGKPTIWKSYPISALVAPES